MSDTKEIDLEMCVNKEHAEVQPVAECKECEGYNYNCVSYYAIKEKIRYEKPNRNHDRI